MKECKILQVPAEALCQPLAGSYRPLNAFASQPPHMPENCLPDRAPPLRHKPAPEHAENCLPNRCVTTAPPACQKTVSQPRLRHNRAPKHAENRPACQKTVSQTSPVASRRRYRAIASQPRPRTCRKLSAKSPKRLRHNRAPRTPEKLSP